MYSIDLPTAIAREHHARMLQEAHTRRIIRSVRQRRSFVLYQLRLEGSPIIILPT